MCGRVVRAGRARSWRRYGHVTVGETGADPAHDGVFAPHREQLVALGDAGERLEVLAAHCLVGDLGVAQGHAPIAVPQQLHNAEQTHATVHQ